MYILPDKERVEQKKANDYKNHWLEYLQSLNV